MTDIFTKEDRDAAHFIQCASMLVTPVPLPESKPTSFMLRAKGGVVPPSVSISAAIVDVHPNTPIDTF